MRTRPAPSEVFRDAERRARLARPRIIVIDDAEAYWIEDQLGRRRSPESPSSAAPLAAAAGLLDAGHPADALRLVCRLTDGQTPVIAGGIDLAAAALGSVGRGRSMRPDADLPDASGVHVVDRPEDHPL